jgi:hypothetical protein
VDGFDEEVVVDGVALRIVDRVVQDIVAERDVADRGVELAVAESAGLEALGPYLRGRVQVGGDRGGDRVDLDSDEPGGVADRVGDQADEVTGPRAGLEHPTAGEPEPVQGVPAGGGDAGVGVVGVEGGRGGGAPLGVGEQRPQLVADPGVVSGRGGVPLVEHGGQRPPAGPAGENLLLAGGGVPVLLSQGAQRAQGGQVGLGLRLLPCRGQVVLPARPEPAAG